MLSFGHAKSHYRPALLVSTCYIPCRYQEPISGGAYGLLQISRSSNSCSVWGSYVPVVVFPSVLSGLLGWYKQWTQGPGIRGPRTHEDLLVTSNSWNNFHFSTTQAFCIVVYYIPLPVMASRIEITTLTTTSCLYRCLIITSTAYIARTMPLILC